MTATEMAKDQREISVSEFFSKNRHLLGFDNPKRALLTTVKEAVDNSLDACEEAGILPTVHVDIKNVDEKEDRYRAIIRDNGPGIVREQVGKIFGKLLYGSKFHRLKMSRGQQGIGISAAGMYGQLTTGKPIVIISRTEEGKEAAYFEVVMNTKTNEPKISTEDTVEWEHGVGTSVRIDLEGHYQRGKWSVDQYLRQTAMANPHISLHYSDPDGRETCYERAVHTLPDDPRAIKPHPHGIELGTLIQILQDTDSRTLKGCLQNDFSRVSRARSLEICENAGLYENARPKRIARQEAENLLDTIHNTKLRNPPMDCLAPIGEEQIKAGLDNILEADFIDCVTRKPSVYRGIPFLIEIGIAYGGDLKKDKPARLMRFANRVPLLYKTGACVMTQACRDMNWRQYKVDQPTGSMPVGPMMVLVHVASPWVPFTSESKEAVASYPKIEKEVTLALQQCARKLRVFLNKRHRKKEEKRKRRYIENYIPHIGEALRDILDFDETKEEQLVEDLTDILKSHRTS